MIGLKESNAHDMTAVARYVLAQATKIFQLRENWEGRRGGNFIFAEAKTGVPLLSVLLGNVPMEKLPKYFQFSLEKAARLSRNLEKGHVTSAESTDVAQQQFGGSILTDPDETGRMYIMSFSGLPEADIRFGGDTAVMLVTAVLCRRLTMEHARVYAERIGNQLFETLFIACDTTPQNPRAV